MKNGSKNKFEGSILTPKNGHLEGVLSILRFSQERLDRFSSGTSHLKEKCLGYNINLFE